MIKVGVAVVAVAALVGGTAVAAKPQPKPKTLPARPAFEPSSTARSEQACPSTFAPGFEGWSYPSEIAWGRTGEITAKAHVFTWWKQRHVAVGIGDLDPTEQPDSGVKYDGLSLSVPVAMPRSGRGLRVRILWTLVNTDSANPTAPCEQAKEIFIRGGLGARRGFRERLRMGFPANSSVYWEPLGPALHGAECARFAAVPATLTVTDGRSTRSVTVRDQCEFDLAGSKNQITRKAATWDVSASRSAGFNGGFWLSYWGLNPASLRYRITVGDQVVRKGTLVAHPHYKAERMIWQGTDDFVNVCINHLLLIRSKGGRLYCVAPGSYSATFTRKP
jgi:hypothetical protein